MRQVSALDEHGGSVASFHSVLAHRREFIAGISTELVENKELISIKPEEVKSVPNYLSKQPLRFAKKSLTSEGWTGRALVIVDANNTPQNIVVTNAMASRIPDNTAVRLYTHRHPHHPTSGKWDGPVRPTSRKWDGQTAEDYLRVYAGFKFKGSEFTDEQWQAALNLQGQVELNDHIWRVTLSAEGLTDSLLRQASQAVNSLFIKDEKNRPIWILWH